MAGSTVKVSAAQGKGFPVEKIPASEVDTVLLVSQLDVCLCMRPRHAMPYHAVPRYVVSRHATLPCHVVSGVCVLLRGTRRHLACYHAAFFCVPSCQAFHCMRAGAWRTSKQEWPHDIRY